MRESREIYEIKLRFPTSNLLSSEFAMSCFH
jgi:hypothetical protein